MSHRTDTGLYFDAEARAMERRDRELIPRRLVIAMFSLALASVLIASFAVLTHRPLVGVPDAAPIVTERTLLITAHGKAITVTDANSGAVVMDKANGGFVSVVNDGMKRARMIAGVSGNPAVTVTLYENSRIALADPASGWHIDLSSFGPGNARVWLDLLKTKT